MDLKKIYTNLTEKKRLLEEQTQKKSNDVGRIYKELGSINDLVCKIDEIFLYEEYYRSEPNLETLQEINRIKEEVKKLLIQEEYPNELIIEIRPAVGGDEASLFAEDVDQMYRRFILSQNWSIEELIYSEHDGLLKLSTFIVRGKQCYEKMFLESGVHRVQRVPKTEVKGRIHTSTITVAVLRVAPQKNFNIPETDLSFDYYRSSGAGGQHVNTTNSAVRVTHLPTKIVVQCQNERSQHSNKDTALRVLYAKVSEYYDEKERAIRDENRQNQIGSGDRSEKIRTYNFPQNRITDHRFNVSILNLDRIIQGDIKDFIDRCYAEYQEKLISSLDI